MQRGRFEEVELVEERGEVDDVVQEVLHYVFLGIGGGPGDGFPLRFLEESGRAEDDCSEGLGELDRAE